MSLAPLKSHTGDPDKTRETGRLTLDWVKEVASRGAGEIVLNCMNRDGVRKGYDIAQLKAVREICGVTARWRPRSSTNLLSLFLI